MKVLLRKTPKGDGWQVLLDRNCISFRREEEASAFMATLQTRLQAPHPLPMQERQAG